MPIWEFNPEKKEIDRKTEILIGLIGKKIEVVSISYKDKMFGYMKRREKEVLEEVKDGSIKIKYHDKIRIGKIILIREF